MIIDKNNLFDKIPNKIKPEKLEICVSILSFIITEDEAGLVLYKEGDKFVPFFKSFELNKINKKIKFKTNNDLISQTYLYFSDENSFIEKTTKEFNDSFITNVNIKVIGELFELNNEENLVKLIKHNLCVIEKIDSLENTFTVDSKIVPFANISSFVKENKIPDYLYYFLTHKNIKLI